uniref:RNase H type-1 domain-containing protein n=1 Tax=Fagus sylvatica TaxID=28930 RepID=A0A2N9I0W7_FAGSY
MHVFWDSEYEKAVWQASPFSSLWMKHRGGSWSDLVEVVLKEMASPDIELFVTIAWKIWGSRNECWLHKPHTDAASLGAQALAYTEEFLEANQKQKSALSTSTKSWIPPMDSFVNMNVAWKFQKSMKSYGMGAIIRDHNGALMVTFNRVIPLSGDGLKMAAQSLPGAELGRATAPPPLAVVPPLILTKSTCVRAGGRFSSHSREISTYTIACSPQFSD